jgi:hypothetical protein
MQVHGDAFLARVFDNEDDFKRLDLTLKEVNSSATWVKVTFSSMLPLCMALAAPRSGSKSEAQ